MTVVHHEPGLNRDKVFKRGHFSLYRNVPTMNRLFLEPPTSNVVMPLDMVLGSIRTQAFDESTGIHQLALAYGQRVFVDEVAADISSGRWRMTMIPALAAFDFPFQIFYWERGHVIQRFLSDEGAIGERELCYVHFKRRAMPIHDELGDTFLISSNGFRSLLQLPTSEAAFDEQIGGSVAGEVGMRIKAVRRLWRSVGTRLRDYTFSLRRN